VFRAFNVIERGDRGHRLVLLAQGVLFLGLVLGLTGCQNEAPPDANWWTDADVQAAKSELDAVRDVISTRGFIEGAVEGLGDSATIIASDLASANGDSMVKVRRLLGFGLLPADLGRRDSLLFGVTVDSLTTDSIPGDSFCYVMAIDSSLNGLNVTQFDAYWVVHYKPDTLIDTTASPPETTINYSMKNIDTVALSTPTELQKEAPTYAKRYVYLRKQGATYDFRRMSGFSMYLPTTSDAPSISYVALSYQGVTDTFRLNAQANHRGVYNLRDRDSLYRVRKGESLQVFVKTGTPSKAGDLYYYLARAGGSRFYMARGDAMTAPRAIAFSEAGLKHLFVEVIPQSNLLYPGSKFTAAIWSLPVEVTE
jgi:hypothetical protein